MAFEMSLALKIFYVGTRFGLDQAKLGFAPEKMLEDDVLEIMRLGLAHYTPEIEKYLEGLVIAEDRVDWWACHMTAKDIYRIGLLEGFAQFEQTKPCSKGIRILDEWTIDKLTQKVFAQSKSYDEVNE
jgi:hypothetical protein